MSRLGARELSRAVPIARNRWAAGYRTLELPDLQGDEESAATAHLRRFWLEWQVALLQGFVRRFDRDSVLQLRFIGHGSVDRGIEVEVWAAASSEEAANTLSEHLRVSFPEGLVTAPLAESHLMGRGLPQLAPHSSTNMLCELRRARISIEPMDVELGSDPEAGYCFPWPGGPQAMVSMMAFLAEQDVPITFVVQAQGTTCDAALMSHLRASIDGALAQESVNPFREDVARVYHSRMRDLVSACFLVKTYLVSDQAMPPGVGDAIAVTLSEQEAYQLVVPQTEAELHRELLQLRELSGVRRRDDHWPGDRLLHTWSLRELIRVFHVPLPPAGGFTHLASSKVRRLPRSPQSALTQQELSLGTSLSGMPVTLSLGDVNKHVLFAGLPGFGKTTTVHRLLLELSEQGVPFMVVDPAKDDYATLVETMRAAGRSATYVRLTPGVPALNPLAIPAGCSREAHMGRVLAAFDSALRISEHWPFGYFTLARALASSYAIAPAGQTPTLEDLKDSIRGLLDEEPFDAKVRSDIQGNLLGRLDYLTSGPLGVSLSASSDSLVDWDAIMGANIVISLRGFAGPVERSLLFGLLFASIASYRESHAKPGGLGHVMVLEEAHRVLGGAASESEGARLFVEAVAELRGSGEGFIVVDQAPSSLHPQLAKICGTVISHRLVSRLEREAAGSALTLDDRQSEDLARLEQGEVVLHAPSGRAPVTLTVHQPPEFPSSGHLDSFATTLLQRARLDRRYCTVCRGRCRTQSAEMLVWREPWPLAGVQDGYRALKAAFPEMSRAQSACVMARWDIDGGRGDLLRLGDVWRGSVGPGPQSGSEDPRNG